MKAVCGAGLPGIAPREGGGGASNGCAEKAQAGSGYGRVLPVLSQHITIQSASAARRGSRSAGRLQALTVNFTKVVLSCEDPLTGPVTPRALRGEAAEGVRVLRRLHRDVTSVSTAEKAALFPSPT